MSKLADAFSGVASGKASGKASDMESSEGSDDMAETDEAAPDAEVLAMKSFMKATSPEAKASALKDFLEACGAVSGDSSGY